MKNKFKLMMSATGMISALALPGLAQAADGTITFNGTVTDSTCTVQVNNAGAGDGIVTLPTVSKSLLQNAGDTAGATNFTLNLSGCSAASGNTKVNAFFEAGAGVDPATGDIIDTSGTGPANVVVQLFVANNLTSQIKPGLDVLSQVKASDILLTAGTGTLNYVAQYYATAAAGAGSFSSNVTYSLTYN